MKDVYLDTFTDADSTLLFAELKVAISLAGIVPTVKQVMKKNGPLGLTYDSYKGVHQCLDILAQAKYKGAILDKFLPLAGVKERLDKEELQVLDVGCGTGYHVSVCAAAYPMSYFTGIDITYEAVELANERKDDMDLENVDFLEMNAQNLPDDWSRTFDWISMYDACHDQTRPDLSLKEIYRVLKNDGVFTMVDIKGTSNPYEDRKVCPEIATARYAFSLYHCLPVASNSPDAMCLGTMWGEKRALKLLKECGFNNVEVRYLPFAEGEVLYRCKK